VKRIRRRRLRSSGWDGREGLELDGMWFGPEEVHWLCANWLARYDALPPEVRKIVQETGQMPDRPTARGSK
jgi:hypothetical protein